MRGRGDTDQPAEVGDPQIGCRRLSNLPNQQSFEALRDSGPLMVGQIIGERRPHPANNRDRQFRVLLGRKEPQTELQILHRRHSQITHAVPQRAPQQRAQKRIGDPGNSAITAAWLFESSRNNP